MLLGKNSPWLQCLHESLEKIGSMLWGHTCPDLLWQPSKAERIRKCWQVELIIGRVRNGAAEEDWCWDLSPGGQPYWGEDHTALAENREERTILLWQSGDLVVATQLMVLGAWIPDFYFFSWDTVPRTGQREKEGLRAPVGILKDFSILMKTLSH